MKKIYLIIAIALLAFGQIAFLRSQSDHTAKSAPSALSVKDKMATDLINATYKHTDEELIVMIDAFVAGGGDLEYETKHGQNLLRTVFHRRQMIAFKHLVGIGANPDSLSWPDGFMSIAIGTLPEVETAFPDSSAAMQRTKSGLTPFLFAVSLGHLDMAQSLYNLTPSKGRKDGRFENGAIFYAAENQHAEMIDWLLSKDFDINETSLFGETALHAAAMFEAPQIVKKLIDAGADIHAGHNVSAELKKFPPTFKGYEPSEFDNEYEAIFTPMYYAVDLETAILLYKAGAPIDQLDGNEIKRQIIGASKIPEQTITQAEFKIHQYRIFGKSNPELTNHPYWLEQIRTHDNGYIGFTRFSKKKRNYNLPAHWSFDRYGQSITELPDGRWLLIAGEHEDSYDADFCIYNDVVILGPQGEVQVYSYPKKVFQPTDFHTATQVGSKIMIIGNLGYQGKRRSGVTPVYQLDLESFAISTIETKGANPGWISDHEAKLVGDKIVISGGQVWNNKDLVPNNKIWELSLTDLNWTSNK